MSPGERLRFKTKPGHICSWAHVDIVSQLHALEKKLLSAEWTNSSGFYFSHNINKCSVNISNVSGIGLSAVWMSAHLICTTSLWGRNCYFHLAVEKTGTQRLSMLTNVTQLAGGRAAFDPKWLDSTSLSSQGFLPKADTQRIFSLAISRPLGFLWIKLLRLYVSELGL